MKNDFIKRTKFYKGPSINDFTHFLFFIFLQEKTDQPLDTNHITRLSLDGLATSESMPLLNEDDLLLKSLTSSRCSSSLSLDQLSTMTAITSFDVSEDASDLEENNANKNLTVQNLIVISKDPSPDLRLRMRPRPSSASTTRTGTSVTSALPASGFKDNISNGILLANHSKSIFFNFANKNLKVCMHCNNFTKN